MVTLVTKSVGSTGRDYATLQLALAAITADDADLTNSDKKWLLELYADSTFDMAGTDTIDFSGFTTSSTQYIHVRAASTHEFVPWSRAGVVFNKTLDTASGTHEAFKIASNFVVLEGFGLFSNNDDNSSAGTHHGIAVYSNADNVVMRNLYVRWGHNGAGFGGMDAAYYFGLNSGAGSSDNAQCFNCIAHGGNIDGQGAMGGFFVATAYATVGRFYGCVSYKINGPGISSSNGGGFASNGATGQGGLTNCAAIECGTFDFNNFSATTATPLSYNCASTSGVLLASSALNGGLTNIAGNLAFVNGPVDDFRNRLTSKLLNATVGVDPSLPVTDAVGVTWDYDFANVTRTGDWEIGAYDGPTIPSTTAPTTTIRSIGASGRDYATIELWRAATEQHLIANNVVEIGELYDDGDFAQGGTPLVIGAGLLAVADAVHYRELRPAANSRYDPANGSGAYITGSGDDVVRIEEAYFRIGGCGIENTNSSSGVEKNCLDLRGDYSVADGVFGKQASATATTTVVFESNECLQASYRNCIAIGGVGTNGASAGFRVKRCVQPRVHNCVASGIDKGGAVGDGFVYGIDNDPQGVVFQNCISVDSGDEDFNMATGAALQSYCIASDTTAEGPGSLNSKTAATLFEAPSSSDFRLKVGSAAVNAGIALRSQFVTDYTGEPVRRTPWDCGVYDGVATPPETPATGFGVTSRKSALWVIDREDGQSLFLTDNNRTILFRGQTFLPTGGLLSSARRKEDAMREHNMSASGAIISSGTITHDDLHVGRYNNAILTEYVVDWRYPFAAPDHVARFQILSTRFDGVRWSADLVGLARRAQVPVGETFGTSCRWRLGQRNPDGTGCLVDLTPNTQFAEAVTAVTVGMERREFDASAISASFADSYFAAGTIRWLTGNNVDLDGELKAYTQSTRRSRLQLKMPFDIVVGDTFDLEPGCNKMFNLDSDGAANGDCVNKFSNAANFRGYPWLPGTDRLLQTPQQ